MELVSSIQISKLPGIDLRGFGIFESTTILGILDGDI